MQAIYRVHLFFPTKLSHNSTYPTSSSLQSRFTIPLTAIRFEFLYPWIMFPNTGKIPDNMICPILSCFVFFSRFLYFSTIDVVPSLSALFVPMYGPSISSSHDLIHSLCHMLYSCSRLPLSRSTKLFTQHTTNYRFQCPRVSYVNLLQSILLMLHNKNV